MKQRNTKAEALRGLWPLTACRPFGDRAQEEQERNEGKADRFVSGSGGLSGRFPLGHLASVLERDMPTLASEGFE